MKIRSLTALICILAMLSGICTACGDHSSSAEEKSTASPAESTTTAEAAETIVTTEAIEFEKAAEPKDGDAFLYINDKDFFVGFNGTNDGTNSSFLTYAAECPAIKDDGDYTVSVDAGTKGCQWAIAGGPNDGSYQCSGISFAAVIIKGGTTLYPEMSIEIKEIRIDGQPATLTAKNYTSSDDGKEMRANIYNEWVSSFPEDAHTAEGAVTGKFGEYSPQIIRQEEFQSWTKIEVDFTVSGIDEEETSSTNSTAGTTATQTTSST